MRHLTSLVILCCVVFVTDAIAAAPIYRWRDASGVVSFSNRPAVVPEGATEVMLPPLVAAPPVVRRAVAPQAPPVVVSAARRARAACPAPDPSGLVDAVAERLGPHALENLTLVVGGVPVAYGSDTTLQLKGPDPETPTTAPAGQAAIAIPDGAGCPSQPPLERYVVSNARGGSSRRLCDDFRRAFAEVGVAVSRDQGVARSFRAVAQHYLDVAANGYTAGGRSDAFVLQPGALMPIAYAPEDRIPLAPWIVEAHVAQAHELAGESSALVDELSVALEEIDGAARAAGCW